MTRDRDRVAFVTGAGSGIGRATALRLAGDGLAVMCADLDEDGARHTSALVREAGGNGSALRLDVTSSAEVETALLRTIEELGSLDVVVNNAGAVQSGTGTGRCASTSTACTTACCTAAACSRSAVAAPS